MKVKVKSNFYWFEKSILGSVIRLTVINRLGVACQAVLYTDLENNCKIV